MSLPPSAALEINNCVLVVKQTVVTQNSRAARLAARGDITARRLTHAHEEHIRTADSVRESLASRAIKFVEMIPHKFTASEKKRLGAADLIVTVGGDGTVLGSSHYVREGVMLGVNSAPRDSIGHFCFARRNDFSTRLDAILAGRLRPLRLARLAIDLDGKQLPELALNDVLIAHESPAATTRYLIKVGNRQEEHRSSGIWISTAAGSTAGILSAGGRAIPQRSRRIQYLVRELYREADRTYQLSRGFLKQNDEIVVACKMPEGRLYIDGSRTMYRVLFGTRATIKIAEMDLRIFLASRGAH